jgi:hypothetical protein
MAKALENERNETAPVPVLHPNIREKNGKSPGKREK